MSVDCTIITDGTSDKMLLPAIKWCLVENHPDTAFNITHANIRSLHQGQLKLCKRACLAVELYPCQILFVHRDAEREDYEVRLEEIREALRDADCTLPKLIPVVPVRMSESWLLFNEESIRHAAGNPNGRISLDLPSISKIEKIANPKKKLHDLLKKATELNPRRLKRFNPHSAIHYLSQEIDDYSALLGLSAYQKLFTIIKGLDISMLSNSNSLNPS